MKWAQKTCQKKHQFCKKNSQKRQKSDHWGLGSIFDFRLRKFRPDNTPPPNSKPPTGRRLCVSTVFTNKPRGFYYWGGYQEKRSLSKKNHLCFSVIFVISHWFFVFFFVARNRACRAHKWCMSHIPCMMYGCNTLRRKVESWWGWNSSCSKQQ